MPFTSNPSEGRSSTAAHTPGPWEIQSNLVGPLHIKAGGETIAMVGSEISFDRCAADARLIAAAPDMLAALEAIVKWADELGLYAEAGTQLAPVFEVGRAAIAKATP